MSVLRTAHSVLTDAEAEDTLVARLNGNAELLAADKASNVTNATGDLYNDMAAKVRANDGKILAQ